MKLKYVINVLPLLAVTLVVATSCTSVFLPDTDQSQGSGESEGESRLRHRPKVVNVPENRQFPQSEEWEVVRVTDGDSITVRQGSRKEKIRFCGIDAVEKQQKLGTQATDYLRSLINLGDGTVSVTLIEKDRYERTVAELFVKPRPGTPGYQPEEEIFLNGEMVKAGFARHYPLYSGSCPNKEVIEKSEAIARSTRVGFWSDPNAVAPWDYRKLKRQNKGN